MKRIGVILHATRAEAARTAAWLAERLAGRGIEVRASASDAARIEGSHIVPDDDLGDDLDLVFVLGGDGTLLRAVDVIGDRAPLLGVNFGHLGFLSELERSELDEGLHRVIEHGFDVEERMLLEAEISSGTRGSQRVRALNDIIVGKEQLGRSIRVQVAIGGEPFVTWAADGVIAATATGSTAYSFSAGGPVVSPRLDCIVLTPVSAHGLFTRAVVVPPDEPVEVRLIEDADSASLSVDGGPTISLDAGSTVTVRGCASKVRLAKVAPAPFWRLVREKFQLPSDPG